MMTHRSSKGDKSLDSRWVAKARTAKETTDGLEDWSTREIERWDLNDPERTPTGKKHDPTWQYTDPMVYANRDGKSDPRPDARENPRIRDGTDRRRRER
jgi:hypothetical protein